MGAFVATVVSITVTVKSRAPVVARVEQSVAYPRTSQ